MADNLKISLKLDIQAFKTSLASGLDLTKAFKTDFDKVLSGAKLTADSSELEKTYKQVEKKLEAFEKEKHETELKANSTSAEKNADSLKAKVKGVPTKKTTDFKANTQSALTSISQLSMAYMGIAQMIGNVKNKLSEYISLANIQEQAEQKLASTLKIKGEYTDESFEAMKKYASSIQEVTTVGDEQSLKLMAQAVNFGISTDRMNEATKGSIGLAEKFADAQLSQETALKGIALAMSGNFSQMERYIPALRSAGSESEKMAILQKEMGDGFDLAKEKAKTGAGRLEQFGNSFGDLKEKIGDIIKVALIPLISQLKNVVDWVNNNKPVITTVLATIMAGVVALTAKWLILNAAMLANPVVLISAGVLALAVGIGKVVQELGGWEKAWAKVKEWAVSSIEQITTKFNSFMTFLQGACSLTITLLTAPYQILWETVKSVFSKISNIMSALLSGDFSTLKEEISNGLSGGFTKVSASIQADVEKMKSAFAEVPGAVADANAQIEANQDAHDLTMEEKRLTKEELKKQREEEEKAKKEAERQLAIETEIAEFEEDVAREQEQYLLKQEIETQREEEEKAKAIEESKAKEKEELAKAKEDLKKHKDALKEKGAKEEDFKKIDEAYATKISLIKATSLDEQKKAEEDFQAKKEAIKSAYRVRELKVEGKDFQARLEQENQYYKQAMENAKGDAKEQALLTKEHEKNVSDIKRAELQNRLSMTGDILGQLNTIAGAFGKDGAKVQKRIAQGQAVINMAKGISTAVSHGFPAMLWEIPLVTAVGVAQIATIEKQEFATGGLVNGKSHAQGGVQMLSKNGDYFGEMEGGEYIISKNRTAQLGKGFLDSLNFGSVIPKFNIGGYIQSITPKFNLGGMVQSVTRFADGGLVPAVAGGGNMSGGSLDLSPITSRLDNIQAELSEQRNINVNVQSSLNSLEFWVEEMVPAKNTYEAQHI